MSQPPPPGPPDPDRPPSPWEPPPPGQEPFPGPEPSSGYGQPPGQEPPSGYGPPSYEQQPAYGQPSYEQPGQLPHAPQWGQQPPYAPQGPYGQYGPPSPGPTRGTNVLAILSLVFAFVFSPAGIVLGHLAKRQLRTSGEEGDQLATWGLILGYVFTGLGLLVCCGWIALVAFTGVDGTTY
ncbi:DUF4190 domain-containing protein [Micromonospora sp. C28SCA-DRY-2]|uniref:DUF4190 domain-containing protein n=1 Tax=Micromonospora sp. C28SCA-DRY-2 TaxID=3059522 RepID=UPI002676EA23|nr:DUF4190 domain-containing protein [Micromonospora sp. C28SCA-DRY-2]MDO3701379.1 DUF4190 domain-containing protein [Micromonospora sp. C28SCA-DRY-2]